MDGKRPPRVNYWLGPCPYWRSWTLPNPIILRQRSLRITLLSLFPGLTAVRVLDHLRSCSLFEVAFLSCDIDTYTDSEEVVSLSLLRSFTHKLPRDECNFAC